MTTDALARRLRFAPPNPRIGRMVLTEADHLIFEALDRHGPLPTHFLYEFTRRIRRDYTHFQHRLTEFYNGDGRGAYLARPQQQFAAFEARYQHLVYDLAPRARLALEERGSLARYSPKRTDAFLHRLMSACVGASLELSARRKGLRYIPREEIFAHPRCPEATKQTSNPLAVPIAGYGARTSIVPDDLFGLEYPGIGFRFFAVEIDRNTESIERKNLAQRAFGFKVAGYLSVLRNRLYLDHWGVPNLHVLTVTTNATHALNLAGHVGRHADPGYADRFAFASDACFGVNWRVPREVLSHLFDKPWLTPTGAKEISTA